MINDYNELLSNRDRERDAQNSANYATLFGEHKISHHSLVAQFRRLRDQRCQAIADAIFENATRTRRVSDRCIFVARMKVWCVTPMFALGKNHQTGTANLEKLAYELADQRFARLMELLQCDESELLRLNRTVFLEVMVEVCQMAQRIENHVTPKATAFFPDVGEKYNPILHYVLPSFPVGDGARIQFVAFPGYWSAPEDVWERAHVCTQLPDDNGTS